MTRKPARWNSEEIIEGFPLEDKEVRWAFLATGEYTTLNYVVSSDVNMPHIHDEHDEILYVLEGDGSFLLGEETVPLKKGDLFFVPKGTVHTPIVVGRERMISIYAPAFDPENPDRRFI